MNKVETSEKMLARGDFDDLVGSDMGGFGEVLEGLKIQQISGRGMRLLDWAAGNGLHLLNTCFLKGKIGLQYLDQVKLKQSLIYLLVNKKYRNSVKDMKVISGEEIMSQHCLLLMDMVFKKRSRAK